MICERVLEERGAFADVRIHDCRALVRLCNWGFLLTRLQDLIPLDDDLLSLELDAVYRDCFLVGSFVLTRLMEGLGWG
jgi:hypothetical protein